MKKAGTSIIILSIVFFIINVATMNNRVDSNSNSLYGIIIFFLASLFWALIGGIFYMIASVKDGNTFKNPLAYLKKLDPAIDRSWEKALIREGSAYVKQHKHEPNVAWHAIYEAALKKMGINRPPPAQSTSQIQHHLRSYPQPMWLSRIPAQWNL